MLMSKFQLRMNRKFSLLDFVSNELKVIIRKSVLGIHSPGSRKRCSEASDDGKDGRIEINEPLM